MISGTQSITMSDKEDFSVDIVLPGMPVDRNAKFGSEIIKHPHVMVSCENNQWYSLVNQICKLSLNSNKSLWDGFLVFEPEVKNIANQEDGFRIFFDHIEPFDDFFLPDQTLFFWLSAQVKITGKIYFFPA